MSNTADDTKESRVSTITSVTNTLKFFALSLLIVEAIIGVLAAASKDTADIIQLGYLATFMFIFVVVMVVILAFFRIDALLAKSPSDLFKQSAITTESLKKLIVMLDKKLKMRERVDLEDPSSGAITYDENTTITVDPERGELE